MCCFIGHLISGCTAFSCALMSLRDNRYTFNTMPSGDTTVVTFAKYCLTAGNTTVVTRAKYRPVADDNTLRETALPKGMWIQACMLGSILACTWSKATERQHNPRFHRYEEPYTIDFSYHNYEQMSSFLRTTSLRFQNLTALYSIGKSVKGRDLWVMVISSSPYEHMIGKPDVKYVANIHGNEAVGRELMLHLIHLLVTTYGSDHFVTWLLDNTRIHILPSMNPDGFEVSKEGDCDGGQGRYNARGFDLNRNFPDYFKQNNKKSQPETEAVKEWISKIQFVLSGSLHGGALVASYPFDNTPNSLFQSYSLTPSISPDDDVFQHLSLTYSRNHGSMHRGRPCSTSQPSFRHGITNGAEWYPLTGGMQDFNYVWNGCMEITLELSCCKYPLAVNLPHYWKENHLALLKFLAEAHRGVHGFVIDQNGNPIERASIKVKSRNVGFLTTKYGEFWRILLPGFYKFEIYANSYIPRDVEFVVAEDRPTLLNVTLYSARNHLIDSEVSASHNRNPSIKSYPHRDYMLHVRPQQESNIASDTNNGIFASLSNRLNSLVTNLFG
ncbi:hypothetical protein KM043_017625 [Ampulex compressa]|nr:hypothetical protein KM043_017625 [Ampulex compressa]